MSEFSFTDVWEHLSCHSSSKQAYTSTVMGEGVQLFAELSSRNLRTRISRTQVSRSCPQIKQAPAPGLTRIRMLVSARYLHLTPPPPVVKHTLLKYYHIKRNGESSKLWTNIVIYHLNIDQLVIQFKRENIDVRRSFRWQVMFWCSWRKFFSILG